MRTCVGKRGWPGTTRGAVQTDSKRRAALQIYGLLVSDEPGSARATRRWQGGPAGRGDESQAVHWQCSHALAAPLATRGLSRSGQGVHAPAYLWAIPYATYREGTC